MIPLPTIDVLDSITIPVACPESWDAMEGDHRTRFCNKCSQNVHEVSELTTAEAVQLVTGSEKMPCLRLYRRPDGRVMTRDCLTKRERAWKWLHRRSAWAAACFALLFLGCTNPFNDNPGKPCVMGEPPVMPNAPSHDTEQVARRATTADHTARESRMEVEAKAEAPVRHETATE